MLDKIKGAVYLSISYEKYYSITNSVKYLVDFLDLFTENHIFSILNCTFVVFKHDIDINSHLQLALYRTVLHMSRVNFSFHWSNAYLSY